MPSKRKLFIYLAAVLAGSIAVYMLLIAPRRARDPRRVVGCLPAGGHPTLFVDVETLREAGVLDRIAGPAAMEESEYKGFVTASGFDYRKDLDAVAIQIRPAETLMVARGRWRLDKMAEYAKSRGGRCVGELCTVEGSAPERQVSWIPLAKDLLGVAVSRDALAATMLSRGASGAEAPPPGPVWLALPGSVLEPKEGLPPGLSALLSSLAGASRATFVMNGRPEGFEIRLVAPFDDAQRAAASAKRLQEATESLKTLIVRSEMKAEPGSLAAVLAGGKFASRETFVEGSWMLRADFFAGEVKSGAKK